MTDHPCPDVNLKAFQALVEQFGETNAHVLYHRHLNETGWAPGSEQVRYPSIETAKGLASKGLAPTDVEGKDVTGIRNSITDIEREARGLPPREEVMKRAFPELQEKVMADVAKDPQAGTKLVDELKDNIRPLTDYEDALLLHEQTVRQGAHRMAVEAVNNAKTDAERATAELQLAKARDDVFDLYDVDAKTGTANARGLNARKMLVREDYTLAEMEAEKRAAKGGEKLTDEESKHVADLQKQIDDLQKKLADKDAGRQQRIDKIEETDAQEGVDNLVQKVGVNKKRGGKEKSIEDIRAKLTPKEDTESDFNLVSANALSDLARYHIANGKTTLEKLIPAMKADLDPIFPGVTERDIRVALSSYGKSSQPNPAPLEMKLRELKRMSRLTSGLEDANAGKAPLKTGQIRDKMTDDERALDAELKRIIREKDLKALDPQKQMDTALKMLKTRLRNRTIDLQKRLNDQDYAPRVRRTVTDDPESLELRAKYQEVRDKWDAELLKDKMARRSLPEKLTNLFVGFERAMKLSSIAVFGKLSAAAATRMLQTIAEEATITGLRVLPGISKVAEKAPRYGSGLNVGIEAKAITEAFTKGMEDAARMLKTGKTTLDILYKGKKLELPQEWMGVFGQIHGSFKAPVKRAEFTRSFEKRVAWNIKQGVDVNDPVVQVRMANEAYLDANRAIFMNDNWATHFYKNFLNFMEGSKKYPVAGKSVSNIARFLLPIVKVPVNIIGETMEMNPVYAAGKIAYALRDGVASLKPEQADLVMRLLAKGATGSALMVLGYMKADDIGGYYQRGEKREEGDVPAGQFKMFGQVMPKWVTHSPVWEAMSIGATVRRVAEANVGVKSDEQKGIPEGVMVAELGLLGEVPFVDQAERMVKLMGSTQERARYVGDLAKSTLVPAAVSQVATMSDRDAEGKPIKRNPAIDEEGERAKFMKEVWQTIETGLPVLRRTVPEREEK
jgi:hypothetical protein